MNAREFMECLCANYAEALHPTTQAQTDMLRMVISLKLTGDQLQRVYDGCLRDCEFFPKVADIYTQASHLGLVRKVTSPEPAWETWRDKEGRTWARKLGEALFESKEELHERWKREACDPKEGAEAFREAYAMAAEGCSRQTVQPVIKGNELEFDFQDPKVEIEIVDDAGDWNDL